VLELEKWLRTDQEPDAAERTARQMAHHPPFKSLKKLTGRQRLSVLLDTQKKEEQAKALAAERTAARARAAQRLDAKIAAAASSGKARLGAHAARAAYLSSVANGHFRSACCYSPTLSPRHDVGDEYTALHGSHTSRNI
jgi:hypothetical protein